MNVSWHHYHKDVAWSWQACVNPSANLMIVGKLIVNIISESLFLSSTSSCLGQSPSPKSTRCLKQTELYMPSHV